MGWQERSDEAIETRLAANKPIWELARKIKRDCSISSSKRDRYLEALYSSLSDKDIHQSMVVDADKFEIGTSFRASLNELRRTKKHMRDLGVNLFPSDNDKIKDREFAKSLSVPVPEIYTHDVLFEEVELIPNTILKPLIGASAIGVFYIDEECQVHSMKTGRSYDTLHEAKTETRPYEKVISTDNWILEEYIRGFMNQPPHDFKVFSFYGELGMFLEIDRTRPDRPRYASYDESGEPMDRKEVELTFTGSGVPDSLRELSTRISLAAPVPFLRIDFHYGEDGIFLGELTPQPGGVHADTLFEELDRHLGQHFARAKARLYIDMLNGKPFPEFRRVYGSSVKD